MGETASAVVGGHASAPSLVKMRICSLHVPGYARFSVATHGFPLEVLNHSSKVVEPMRGFAPGTSDSSFNKAPK